MEFGYQYEQGRPIQGLQLGVVCKLKLWGIIGRWDCASTCRQHGNNKTGVGPSQTNNGKSGQSIYILLSSYYTRYIL